jgi:hypothetical protein
MSDTRDRQIAEREEQILALRSKPAAPEPEPSPEPDREPDGMPAGWAELHEELAGQERRPSTMYAASRHPDQAYERVLASGHGVGGHAGLGAGASN